MHTNLPREYLSYPALSKASKAQKLVHKAASVVLFPLYWAVAYIVHTPGLTFRRYCALMGIRLLLRGRDIRQAYNLLVSPMDSVRYFEFDFMWRAIRNVEIRSYLDVSSPRLFPLVVVDRTVGLFTDLINPDRKDLSETVSLATSLGISDRCRFHAELIQSIRLAPNSFDVITSISVIEHIPDDTGALRKMWGLLSPGGRLLISVPCAAKASEEYTTGNEYGLLGPDENGFVFWQRYYDEQLLRQRIFCVTGEPRRYSIYGESKSGNYERNMTRKRTDPFYPYWREPFMVGLEYERRSRLSDLPGIGVIAMEFVK
jgi:SAM-dependent methyltransferase